MATLNLKLEDISSEYRPIAELIGTDGLMLSLIHI